MCRRPPRPTRCRAQAARERPSPSHGGCRHLRPVPCRTGRRIIHAESCGVMRSHAARSTEHPGAPRHRAPPCARPVADGRTAGWFGSSRPRGGLDLVARNAGRVRAPLRRCRHGRQDGLPHVPLTASSCRGTPSPAWKPTSRIGTTASSLLSACEVGRHGVKSAAWANPQLVAMAWVGGGAPGGVGEFAAGAFEALSADPCRDDGCTRATPFGVISADAQQSPAARIER